MGDLDAIAVSVNGVKQDLGIPEQENLQRLR
jgi:hypothetical protein